MFIAFEGPDNVGKSTSAAKLATTGTALYNATRVMHGDMQVDQHLYSGPDHVVTYDRIDWFSHMVYRLGLPDKDWNDDRPRTVFAMPDTHLVVKTHHPDTANFTVDFDDESAATDTRTRGIETNVGAVNPMYYYFAQFLMGLNEARGYALFKSVSIVEVVNQPALDIFMQKIIAFDSAVVGLNTAQAFIDGSEDTFDSALLRFLLWNDEQAAL